MSPLQQRPLRSGKVDEQAQRSRAAAESGCGGKRWPGVLCSLSYIKQQFALTTIELTGVNLPRKHGKQQPLNTIF